MTAIRPPWQPFPLPVGAACRRASRLVAAAPVTSAYLVALAGITAARSSIGRTAAGRLQADLSTNLHQLGRVPVRVLLGSAFWTSGWGELVLWLVLFAAIAGPVEHRFGWRRLTATFAAGHVGATLTVAAGLWIGLLLGDVDPAVALAPDVGASYGFFAVAGLAAFLLAPRRRALYLSAVGGYLLYAVALHHTFTDFGHLTAAVIGLASYRVARRAAPA